MKSLYIDYETYSEVPIKHGVYAYAERAEILLMSYAIDDGPARVWDVTCENINKHPDLIEAIIDPNVTVTAHNSMFDRTISRLAANAPQIIKVMGNDVSRWRDTMVKAYSVSLPGALGTLSEIFRLAEDKAKDKEGRQLVLLFCKPRPASSKIRRATKETHPEEWKKFVNYARLDTEAMRELDKKIPAWNYRDEELALWHLDQRINDRGFMVDVDLAHKAIDAVGDEKKALAIRTRELTDDEVQAATQRAAMLKHILGSYGVELPDLQKSTLERRINDSELPIALRELLAIRLQASTTSTSKYTTLVNGVSRDGRLHGTLQFDGAGRTGRWSGRLFQPQNLPRPTLKNEVIEQGIDAVKADCADLIYDNIIELTSSAIRGCITVPRGKKLVVADLSNIEGRGLSWLAWEDWKLKAFHDFDMGNGHDLYKLSYAKSFGVKPDDVNKTQRQIGKVQELALGYEGGVGAFLTFSAAYGIDLEAMAEQAISAIPDNVLGEARSALDWTKRNKRPTFGLSDQAWIVCDSFKRSWRYAHPSIAAFWRELDDAVRTAIIYPGATKRCQSLVIRRDGAWLRIRLPSGRYLCYPDPRVDESGKITYMGMNQYSKKWGRISTYGGKLAENVTQAFSRDVLAYNMPAIEKAGYQIVLSIHDELLTEAPDSDEFTHEKLAALMSTVPPWAEGLPLAAAGFEAYRYRKD